MKQIFTVDFIFFFHPLIAGKAGTISVFSNAMKK